MIRPTTCVLVCPRTGTRLVARQTSRKAYVQGRGEHRKHHPGQSQVEKGEAAHVWDFLRTTPPPSMLGVLASLEQRSEEQVHDHAQSTDDEEKNEDGPDSGRPKLQ